jgi:hypothetical protein
VDGDADSSGAGAVRLRTKTADRLYIENSGYVGIGTTSPLVRLHVGNLAFNNSSGTFITGASANTILTNDYSAIAVQNTNATNNNYARLDFVDNEGNMGASVLGVYTNHTGGSQSADLAFGARNSGTWAEKMRVKANGSVGIGTSSPNLSSWANPTLSLRTVDTANAPAIELYGDRNTADANVGALVFQNNQAAQADKRMAQLKATAGADLDAGRFVFQTADNSGALQERLRIDEYGYLGIGTSQPAAKLHMSSGTLLVDGNGQVPFRLGVSTLIVTSPGFVGIGTSAPSSTLTVAGLIETTGGGIKFADGSIMPSAASGGGWTESAALNKITANTLSRNLGLGTANPAAKLHMSSGTLLVDGGAGIPLQIGVSSLAFTSDNRLGIGTTLPYTALDVDGIARARAKAFSAPAQGMGLETYYDSGADKGVVTAYDRSGAQAKPLQMDGAPLLLASNGSERMRVQSGTGYVGIGTTLPYTRFEVKDGTITVSGDTANLSVGVSTLVAVGGRVGVGTSSPGSKLHMSSGVFLVDGTGAGAGLLGNTGIGTLTPGTRLHVSTGVLTVDGDPAGLSVGASTFVVTGGRVGIGTSQPTEALHIAVGGIRFPDNSLLTSAGTGNAGAVSNNGDVLVDADADTDNVGAVVLRTKAQARLVVDNSGNVGIGTTLPQAVLHVHQGDIKISTAAGVTNAGIVFPDGTRQIAAAVNYYPLRFTRGTINTTDTDGNKDSLCASEWGPNYRAASYIEVVYLSPGEAATYGASAPYYNTAGCSHASAGYCGTWGYYYPSYQLNWTYLYHVQNSGNSNQRLACIRKDAMLQFTRGTVTNSSGDTAKDNQCVTEFGANYRAAQKHDMTILLQSRFYWNAFAPRFNLAGLDGTGYRFYPTYAAESGAQYLAAEAGTYSEIVACLSK